MKKNRMQEVEKTIADLSEAQQIERLARQRNRLFKLIFWFGCSYGSEGQEPVDLEEDMDVSVGSDGKICITIDMQLPEANLGKLADEILDRAEEIVDDVYVMENANCQNGDKCNPHETRSAFIPYYLALPKNDMPEEKWTPPSVAIAKAFDQIVTLRRALTCILLECRNNPKSITGETRFCITKQAEDALDATKEALE